MDEEAHVEEVAKDEKGGGVTVTGKETCGRGWVVLVSGSVNCSFVLVRSRSAVFDIVLPVVVNNILQTLC